jgi:hypothetical protein
MQKKAKTEDLVASIDLPHLRERSDYRRKEWSGSQAFGRLVYYAERLRAMGMSDTDISIMFSDLYWNAVGEYNKTSLPSNGAPLTDERFTWLNDPLRELRSLANEALFVMRTKGGIPYLCKLTGNISCDEAWKFMRYPDYKLLILEKELKRGAQFAFL